MENDNLYQNLITVIKERVPHKELVSMLVDLLIIEKEAVYRRLRGEVPFTFAEIAKIAKKLNISLDTIIGTTSEKSKPFQLKLSQHYNQSEVDYAMEEEFVEYIRNASKSKYSEFGFATSILPLHSSCCYSSIERFYVLRWLYQFGCPGAMIHYDAIQLSERKKKINHQFIDAVQEIKYTYFIWDKLVLYYLISDILYFKRINLIAESDLELLKSEILLFLDDFEMIAIRGAYKNGNKIDMYISTGNFETTYTYLETDEQCLTFIKTFTLDETVSFDRTVFEKLKMWIQTLKRTSVLITGSNELYRIKFFEKQRELVEKMFSKNYEDIILV